MTDSFLFLVTTTVYLSIAFTGSMMQANSSPIDAIYIFILSNAVTYE